MYTLSPESTNNVTKKNYRPIQIVARKRIAYQELTGPEIGKSQRIASKLLKIPRSTFQTWEERRVLLDSYDDGLVALYNTIVFMGYAIGS